MSVTHCAISRCVHHTPPGYLAVRHTLRDTTCVRHTLLGYLVPHNARYHAWCLTVRDTARGASQCAIPHVVPDSARYHAWRLTVRDTARGIPRHAPRDINVHHTLHNIAVCPSHTARLSRCPSHTARYHVCPSHTAGLAGASQCAIPRVVPHSAWCLTVRDTAHGLTRHAPRDINVHHTLRNIAVCPSHTAGLSRCPSHTARYRVSITHRWVIWCLTVRDTARGASQCAIPRVVPHSARYCAWCLTMRDTAHGASQCAIPRMVPHSARYRAWCLTVRDTTHGASQCVIPHVSITHCWVISHGASQCAIPRVVTHSARYRVW